MSRRAGFQQGLRVARPTNGGSDDNRINRGVYASGHVDDCSPMAAMGESHNSAILQGRGRAARNSIAARDTPRQRAGAPPDPNDLERAAAARPADGDRSTILAR